MGSVTSTIGFVILAVVGNSVASAHTQQFEPATAGKLKVTATVIGSVSIVITPKGLPKIIVANSTDKTTTFVRLSTSESLGAKITKSRTLDPRNKRNQK